MSSESAERTAVEQTKQQIRGLVDEISALSKQDLEPQEYYTQFLTKVVEAMPVFVVMTPKVGLLGAAIAAARP